MIATFNNNSKEAKALKAVAEVLNSICTNGYTFTVEDTYFDIGQGWMWTTIIAKRDTSSYQLLCPRDHELITEDICWTRMSQAINNIINDSRKYNNLAQF